MAVKTTPVCGKDHNPAKPTHARNKMIEYNLLHTNRAGKFKVTKEVVEQFWIRAAGIIIPTKIEYSYSTKTFEIEAYSACFKDLSEGEVIPTYMLVFKKIGDPVAVDEVTGV